MNNQNNDCCSDDIKDDDDDEYYNNQDMKEMKDFIYGIFKYDPDNKMANKIFKFLSDPDGAGYPNLSLLLRTPMDDLYELCQYDLGLKHGWKMQFIEAIISKQKTRQINSKNENSQNKFFKQYGGWLGYNK